MLTFPNNVNLYIQYNNTLDTSLYEMFIFCYTLNYNTVLLFKRDI